MPRDGTKEAVCQYRGLISKGHRHAVAILLSEPAKGQDKQYYKDFQTALERLSTNETLQTYWEKDHAPFEIRTPFVFRDEIIIPTQKADTSRQARKLESARQKQKRERERRERRNARRREKYASRHKKADG